MSNEPIPLHTAKLSPHSTVVGILRELLKMAEEGNILAVAATTTQGGFLHAHTFGDGNVAHLLGAAEIMRHHLLKEVEERS